MLKRIALFVLGLTLLAACSPLAASTGVILVPTIPRDPAGKHLPVDQTPVQMAVIQALATKENLPFADIRVFSTQAVSWPNGCLGVQLPGVLCMRGPVQGFRIVLSAGGKQYEYHTNQDGSSILPAGNRLGLLSFAG